MTLEPKAARDGQTNGHSTGRRMMVGGAARAFGLVVRMIVGFFMLPFLVGNLGDYWYGVFAATLGFVANFHLLDFGMAKATMRQIAIGMGRADDDSVNDTINTALRIYLALGGAVFVLILIPVALAPIFFKTSTDVNTVRWVLFIAGIDLAITFPMKAFAGILQASLRYDLFMVVELITLGITVVGNVWVVKAGYGVIALALVSFGGGQLNNLLFVLLARHLFPPFRLQLRTPFNRVRGRELASYSFWSFLIDMANQLRFRVDSLTVGWLFGGVAITRYAIGARLIEYAQSPLVMISNTAMPALAKLHVADQQERTADIVIFLLRLSLLLSVYAGGIVFAVGRPFINRWIGPEHGGSHVIAMLLAVGFLTEVFLMPLTNWLYAAARHRMLAGANAAEAVVNIVLSIILGRQFGLVGVALGTVIPLLLMQLAWVAPHACRSLGLGSRRFLMLAKPGLTSILVVGSTGYLIQRIANANGYLGVVAAATIITAVYWPVVLFLCLGGQDRDFIWRALPLPAFARGFV